MAQDGFIWNVATGVPTKLGTLPGTYATPVAASHDGSVVVGSLTDINNSQKPARWDNGVLTVLPAIGIQDSPVACSADASVIVSNAPGYWTWAGGVATGHVLPPWSGDIGAAVSSNYQGQAICSNDGSIIIGTSNPSGPLFWTNGVPSLLPDGIGIGTSRPTACSDDGSVISGWNNEFPFFALFWRSGTQYQLQFSGGSEIGQGLGIQADGSVIYGQNGNLGAYWTTLSTNNGDGTYGTINQITPPLGFNSGISGYTFANNTSMMTAQANNGIDGPWAARFTGTAAGSILQILAGWLQTTPVGISGDGSIIAGYAQTAGPYVGLTWDALGNARLLETPVGYASVSTKGISRNGAVVYGQVNRIVRWEITSPLNGASESGIGNLWMDNSFVDFSDPSVLAGFVNPDGSWIDVGYYGQLPTGISPLDYLTVQTGNTPNDFTHGYGQSGLQDSWAVVTTGVDPTTGSSYPINLTVDDCGPSTSSAWVISASITGEATDAGIGDVWMNEGFLDFSDPAIRAKFVNTDGTWKYLGIYGELPTGTSPLNWLRIQTGNAAPDILTGYGLNSTQTAWSLLNLGMDPVTGQPYAAMSLDVCPPFAAPIVPGPGDGSSSSSSSSSSTHAGTTGQTGGDKIRVDEDVQWQQYLAWRDKQWRKRQAQKGILVNEPNIPPAPAAPTPVVAPKPKPDPVRVPDRVVDQWQQQMASAHPLLPAAPPAPFNSPPPGKPLPLTQLPSQLDALRRQMKIKI